MNNILDKYRSISIERINEFLTGNCIEHQCTDLNAIEFKLKDWHWDLYMDNNYVKMELVFPITEETITDKQIDRSLSKETCMEVIKRIKVLKAFYTSHSHVDEENDNKIVNYDLLHFAFEFFCYNMYDFGKQFYDGINVILGGYTEYPKLYDELKSKLPKAPVGFTNYNSDSSNEKSQTTNRCRIGFT